jgi:hypothetical protein
MNPDEFVRLVVAFVLFFIGWQLIEAWWNRRQQRRMARLVKFHAWLEGVDRELARRGYPRVGPKIRLRTADATPGRIEPNEFFLELCFANGRSAAEAVTEWLDDYDGLSPDCSPLNVAA